jgi:hypothetical protein
MGPLSLDTVALRFVPEAPALRFEKDATPSITSDGSPTSEA